MSQLSSVAKHLRRHSREGITPSKLAKLAKVDLSAVYRRVYDLRENEGHTIYSNMKNVRGKKRMFYRFAQ